jgi:hypothetical protein
VLPRSTGAEIGMLVVETIAKIRRAHFVQGKPIKQICRELKLSRKVVLDRCCGPMRPPSSASATSSRSRSSAPGGTTSIGCWP